MQLMLIIAARGFYGQRIRDLVGYAGMDIHVETMIRHRHQAIGLLAKARAASDRAAIKSFEKIIGEWDRLLATHGIGPESPANYG